MVSDVFLWRMQPSGRSRIILNKDLDDFVSDKCVSNASKEATTFCANHHLVIFPVWKLEQLIWLTMASSNIHKLSKKSLQTLSHHNILKVIRNIYNWIQIDCQQKVARVYHMTIFSKFPPLGFHVCGPISH